MSSPEIHGRTTSAFAAVKDVFAENFEGGEEVGASFSATLEGETVVDPWAGHADAARTKDWQSNTLINVWSTTKGITALAVAMLVDRGQMRYRDNVAQYWPDFAQAGKSDITIGQLMSHQAGVCGLREPTTVEDYYDWDKMVRRLAATKPFWTPPVGSGYHAVTFGWLAGELVRRVDGRSLGTFVQEEICQPLGADLFIGLPESEEPRVAEMCATKGAAGVAGLGQTDETISGAIANPKSDAMWANDRAWRGAEIPSVNAQTNAKALARIYAALANGGTVDGVRLLGKDAIKRATAEQCKGADKVLGIDMRWGCGWMLNLYGMYGPNDASFGHAGWGGSVGFADPTANVSVGYAMNNMAANLLADRRSINLIRKVYDCI